MGTRADRQSPHHEDTGPFHFVICQKNGFPAHGHVVFLFDIFFAVCVGKPFCAKNFQKCPGVVGSIPDPLGSISDAFRQTYFKNIYIMKIRVTHPIQLFPSASLCHEPLFFLGFNVAVA